VFPLYLLIGFALTILLVVAARWFARVPPARAARAILWGFAIAVGLAILIALHNGLLAALWMGVVTVFSLLNRAAGSRLAWFLLNAVPFLPFLRRHFGGRGGAAPGAGQSSDVETAWLRMSLDHDSGTMDGLVLQGRFRGRRLGELAAPDLLELLAELRVADADSAALLEGYLDAVHAGWRQAQGAGEGAGGGASAGGAEAMTREEAYRVLGLEPGAGPDEVRAAYRELMKRVHPDQGGSAYLAAKLNQAKALLLGE
jgi:hypothetical protein